MAMIIRKYGYIPDLSDHRDLMLSDHFDAVDAAALPSRVDLRPLCSPVEDQGQLGSCTSQAIVGAMEYLENVKHQTFVNLSRLFVYYGERVIENTVNYDAGAMIRDGIKVVASQGVCDEQKLWPYDIKKFKTKPPASAYRDALTRTATSYYRVNSLLEYRQALASGFPCIFGFSVTPTFESQAVARSGILPVPAPGERVIGGHAILGVGYDDGMQAALIRNSWGKSWGLQGHFWMPYAMISDSRWTNDFWVIKA